MITDVELRNFFTYHAPVPGDPEAYALIRAALHLARAIVQHTPPCADQSAAIRHVREAVMTANAARAREGKVASSDPAARAIPAGS